MELQPDFNDEIDDDNDGGGRIVAEDLREYSGLKVLNNETNERIGDKLMEDDSPYHSRRTAKIVRIVDDFYSNLSVDTGSCVEELDDSILEEDNLIEKIDFKATTEKMTWNANMKFHSGDITEDLIKNIVSQTDFIVQTKQIEENKKVSILA